MTTRRRRGSLDRLPAEVRGQVERLILEEEYTYREIRDWLSGKGYQISLSALGRFAKRVLAVRQTAAKARALLEEIKSSGLALDQAVDTLSAQVLMELVSSLDPTEITDFGGFDVGNLIEIQKLALKRQEIEIKRRAQKRLEDQARKVDETADEVAAAAKASGLTDEAAADIRSKILGIKAA